MTSKQKRRQSTLKKWQGFAVVSAAGLAFVAGVVTNLGTIEAAFIKHLGGSEEIMPLAGGAREVKLPQIKMAPSAKLAVTEKLAAPMKAAVPKKVTVTEKLAAPRKRAVPVKMTATEEMSVLSNVTEPVKDGALVDVPVQATADVPLLVEVVQSPKNFYNYLEQWYDVYLRNTSDQDILLSAIAYQSEVSMPHGDATASHVLLPVAKYEIKYTIGKSDRVALSPPFLISAHGRAGIRFHFLPDEDTSMIEGITHHFKAWIVDSEGHRVLIVDLAA